MTSDKDSHPSRFVYQPGLNPEMDAWFTAFFIENHLDHLSYPDLAASPEQIRFMVYTEADERYYPCSDRMFSAIMDRTQSAFLQKSYNAVLQRLLAITETQIEDERDREFLDALVITKFKHETRDEIMIPSRVEKRLLKIFIRRTQIEDPFHREKAVRNRRAAAVLANPVFRKALDHVDPKEIAAPLDNLSTIKQMADALQLRRLLCATAQRRLWETGNGNGLETAEVVNLCRQPITGSGVEAFFDMVGVRTDGQAPMPRVPQKILWLADEAGEIVMDFAVIRHLAALGHKVILVFKGGPLFYQGGHSEHPRGSGPAQRHFRGLFYRGRKGEQERPGTHAAQRLPHLFARRRDQREPQPASGYPPLLPAASRRSTPWCRRVARIKSGACSRPTFASPRICSISPTGIDGGLVIDYKPRHPAVVKFSHADLEAKAQRIIDQMAGAKSQGMTVMFYSGIIGSIPGRIDVAKQIMSTFIGHLRDQSAQTFIIKPQRVITNRGWTPMT